MVSTLAYIVRLKNCKGVYEDRPQRKNKIGRPRKSWKTKWGTLEKKKKN